jgi:hypothetical protein
VKILCALLSLSCPQEQSFSLGYVEPLGNPRYCILARDNTGTMRTYADTTEEKQFYIVKGFLLSNGYTIDDLVMRCE